MVKFSNKFGDQFLKQLSTSMEIHSKTNTPLHLKLYNIASDLLQNTTVPTILLTSYVMGIPMLYLIGGSFLCYHLGIGNRKVALEIICAVDDIVTSLLLNTSNLVLVLFPQFRIEIVAEYFHRYLQESKRVFADAQIYIDRAICTAKGCIIAFKQQETDSKDCSPEVITTITDKTDDLISRGVTTGVRTVVRLFRTVAARSTMPSTQAMPEQEEKSANNSVCTM